MSEPWNEYAIGSQEVDRLLKGYWEHWWITVKRNIILSSPAMMQYMMVAFSFCILYPSSARSD
jgi:hypothetical protein